MNLRCSFAFHLCCVALLAGACFTYEPPVLTTYANSRFGFCVQYPEAHLIAMREAENGDGQTFVSMDKQMTIRAYGFHDTGKPLSAEMAAQLEWWENEDPEFQLHQQSMTDSTYAVSGHRNGIAFDQHTMSVAGKILVIEREYSPEVDDKLLSVSSKMISAFPTCP